MKLSDKLLSRFFRKSNTWRPKPKLSYSQCGEDLIMDFVFEVRSVNKINYIDIGAYDPIVFSNTYYFYSKGSQGVCIEPHPASFKRIKNVRKRDTCLHAGIGTVNAQDTDFYVMNVDTLNTFSLDAVREFESQNYVLKEVIKIPLLNINDVVNKYVGRNVNLITIDTEGMDYEILESFDFQNCRPNIFCVETLNHVSAEKVRPIIDLMTSHGYFSYADTHINTIFIDQRFYDNVVDLNETI